MADAVWAITTKEVTVSHEHNVYHGPLGEPAILAVGDVPEGAVSGKMPDGTPVFYFEGNFETASLGAETHIVDETHFEWHIVQIESGEETTGIASTEEEAVKAATDFALAAVNVPVSAVQEAIFLDSAGGIVVAPEGDSVG